ncbi:MAG: response regulator transcription factor [Crocinitomicaceae bacterium]|nr:response regulator transcription factor [Crocinitomicaceae bacterium]
MKITFLIVEDDVLISEHLKSIILEMGHDVTDLCSDAKHAYASIERNQPDVALLDIRMHGEDQGIQVASRLNKMGIPFIYITSFSDKNTVQSAVFQEPKGYIIKPFTPEEIQESIQKVVDEFDANHVMLRHSLQNEQVAIQDIIYIQSDNVYLEVRTKNKRYIIRNTLSALLKEVNSTSIVRIHRSYAVNVSYISRYNKSSVFIGEEQFPISRKYKDAVDTIIAPKLSK